MNKTETIEKQIFEGELSQQDQIDLLLLLCQYLNLQTLVNYANGEGITYNGAKKRRTKRIVIGGISFVITQAI